MALGELCLQNLTFTHIIFAGIRWPNLSKFWRSARHIP
ncbi:hypothetical protein JMJ77_0011471 [Colletotrichum scovillei]|uniref:Uncharacterized protein n=1 Tax=Colletotrichum scovillei TaxID=1209932 RepID=A0A9P7QVY3_9PEZI|nr:hypothetical protein JMJ77_0011471 [Colletotrichum scovillei]KAG7045750.1 hypothetical protein JMJ78_0010821 [Colletotrichum scovillei]KAG7063098.1 hypothetical protein JMJ76_0005566 [Colletotrichum scovillei]